MNRAERRKARKHGQIVPKEPVLQIKRSSLEAAISTSVDSQVKAMSADVKKKSMDAVIHEIDKQIIQRDEDFSLDTDAMILWALHRCLGWGKKRLTDFYKFMVEEHFRMRKYYQVDDTYPERVHLKEMGVDVEALNKEMNDKWYKDHSSVK